MIIPLGSRATNTILASVFSRKFAAISRPNRTVFEIWKLPFWHSSFKILSSKNNQIEGTQDFNQEKSTLPTDENIPSNDLDDEIPF